MNTIAKYIIRYRDGPDFKELETDQFTVHRKPEGEGGECWSPRALGDELQRISAGPQGVLYDAYGVVAVTWANRGPATLPDPTD